MIRSILSFVLLLAVVNSVGQSYTPPPGDVTAADLNMPSCSFEPDAPAMKLLDVKDIRFDYFYYGSKIKTERRVRIKIFNEKGYKYATIRIPYFSKKGIAKIKELNGAVYNMGENGKINVKKLANWDFFKEKPTGDLGIVSFTFPGVKAGSIVEYRYTTVENDMLSIDPWIIQGEIPVAYTSVIITTPVSSGVTEWVTGNDSVQKTWELLKYDQFRRKIFFKTNIASFHPEPFMSSDKDYLMKAVFMLFPNGNGYYEGGGSGSIIWGMVGSELLQSDYFKKQVNGVIPGTEKIIDTAKKISSLTNRINYIYKAVQERWHSGAEQTIRLHDLGEAWKDRSGTTTEINLTLLNLLNKADIKSLPVLISTRSHGKINKDFPSLGQLNGIDVMAFDSTNFYMLDASIKFHPFNVPPANILNREVFVLNPERMYWATIVDERPLFKQNATIISEMNAEGKLEGVANIQHFDYAKSVKLDTIKGEEEDPDKESIMSNIPAGLKILSANMDITEDPADPLFETISFLYEPNNTNEFYFINPMFFFQKSKNPFFARKRLTDIDMGSNQLIISSLQIDTKGLFEVDDLPKSTVLITPDSSFIFKTEYNFNAGKVFVTESLQSKKAIFSKDEYPVLQEFFKRMYALMEKEIVLKRKK